MMQKNNRPAYRAAEISWGDCNQYTDRRRLGYSSGWAVMTTAAWQHWEIRRYLDAGKFGYFTKEDAR